jgi:hypothetical protein
VRIFVLTSTYVVSIIVSTGGEVTGMSGFKEEKTMKNTSILVISGIILCSLAFWLSGCAQPGESVAEGHRRHLRNLRINQQELVDDVDAMMLSDKPSRLSDKRVR